MSCFVEPDEAFAVSSWLIRRVSIVGSMLSVVSFEVATERNEVPLLSFAKE